MTERELPLPFTQFGDGGRVAHGREAKCTGQPCVVIVWYWLADRFDAKSFTRKRIFFDSLVPSYRPRSGLRSWRVSGSTCSGWCPVRVLAELVSDRISVP